MISWTELESFDRYLDREVSHAYHDQPLAQDWARISKVAEELGEAIQAFIGWTGQNPRKGVVNSLDDVSGEIIDVIITGLLALQHFTKNIDLTARLIDERWDYRMRAAGLK